MRILSITLSILISFSIASKAQTSKTQPKPNSSAVKKAVLNPTDFDYYFLALRSESDPKFTSKYYTLPEPGIQQLVVLDIRTGKEVAWWSFQRTTFSPTKQKIYLHDTYTFSAFHSTGEKLYSVPLIVPESFPVKTSGRDAITLSSEWDRGIFLNNNDIWLTDFDINTGKFSNPKQLTQNGIFFFNCAYLRAKALVTASRDKSYVINIDTGKFQECSGYLDTDIPKGKFVYTEKPALMNIETQFSFFDKPNEWYFGWLNEDHTKFILGVGEQSAFNRKMNEISTLHFVDLTSTTGKSQVLNWNAEVFRQRNYLLYDGALGNSCLPQIKINQNFLFSPNKHFFVSSAHQKPNYAHSDLYLYDIDNLAEEKLNISLNTNDVIKGWSYAAHYRTAWLNDETLLIDARPGDILNGKEINLENKGSYSYNIKTSEQKKLTSYNVDFDNNVSWLQVLQFPKANKAIFQANSYLYTWDGTSSEVKQFAQFPNIYRLTKPFIDAYIK